MFVKILDDVRAWFAARGIDATVDEEVEALLAQDNYGPGTANRVVFVTASPMGVGEPMQIGEDEDGARQLLNATYNFEVHFAGYDPAAPNRVLAHRRQCIALFEAVEQAVHRSACGLYEWGSATWTDARKHARHGAELVVPLTLNVPLFDVDPVVASPSPVPGEPKPVT